MNKYKQFSKAEDNRKKIYQSCGKTTRCIKRIYEFESAVEVAKEYTEKYGSVYRAYKCPSCGYYHVGSSKSRILKNKCNKE